MDVPFTMIRIFLFLEAPPRIDREGLPSRRATRFRVMVSGPAVHDAASGKEIPGRIARLAP
jgi:hypothetical protein